MQTFSRVRTLSLSAILLFSVSAGMLTTIAPKASAAAACTSYYYGYGGTGTCVKYIQTILNGASQNASTCNGYRDSTAILATDGSFGSLTLSRVKAFQKSHCLVNDGSVGPLTWNKLCSVGSQSGYYLSGPGWYDPKDPKDVRLLAAYKASVWAGCNNSSSWPFLMNY